MEFLRNLWRRIADAVSDPLDWEGAHERALEEMAGKPQPVLPAQPVKKLEPRPWPFRVRSTTEGGGA